MRRYFALAAVVAIAIMLWARPATPAGQVQSRPGAGTGVVTVTGTVDLGEAPPLQTMQYGDWKVAVTNAPPAVRAPLGIVRVGGPLRSLVDDVRTRRDPHRRGRARRLGERHGW